MFTNKRQLKKYINRLGDEIVQAVLPAAVCANVITEEKAQEILTDLSALKAQAHSRLDIVFDKAPKDYESPRQYAKERKSYFKVAFHKVLKEYEDGVDALIDQINKAGKK